MFFIFFISASCALAWGHPWAARASSSVSVGCIASNIAFAWGQPWAARASNSSREGCDGGVYLPWALNENFKSQHLKV